MSMVQDIVMGLAKPLTDLVSEYIIDKDKANELAHKVAVMAAEHAHAEVLAQVEVNKAEASSSSWFASSWRPAAGWCCVLGMAMNFLVTPLFGPLISAAFPEVQMVTLDLSVMMPVLLGMLGLTAARSIDKKNGVA
jgi:Tfp pilus assembly protein PilX